MGTASSGRSAGLLLAAIAVVPAGRARAADCNANGTDDARDIAVGASADCNGNGVPDECDVAAPSLEYRFGARYELPGRAATLDTADLDGDGDLDIAVRAWLRAPGISQTTLIIFQNDGAGRFVPEEPMLFRGRPHALVAEDLDGDGHADLAVALSFAVRVLWGGGDTTFGDFEEVPLGSDPLHLVAGDFDGDGDLDLATANFLRSNPLPADNVSVLLNEGGRRFASPRNFVTHRNPSHLESGDLDGDGDLDLLVAGAESNLLMVLANDGEARFREDDTLSVELENSPLESLALGDLDADGALDAAVVEPRLPRHIRLLINNGRGKLESAAELEDPTKAHFVRILDADGDGAMDLVAAGALCETFALFLGDGRGSFPRHARSFDGEHVGSFRAGDWNGDGIPDLAGPLRWEPALQVFFGHPRARSEDCNRNGVPDECEVDCNGNGTLDECELAGGAPDCNRNGVPDDCEPDCDRNGVPDDCDIRDGAATDCDASGIPDSCELDSGDRDRDGVLDACQIARDPSIDCNGNGVPDPLDLLPRLAFSKEEYFFGERPHALAAGDLDGDGLPDLVIAHQKTLGDTVTVASNRRDNGFAAVRQITFDDSTNDLALVDLENDGDLDLVVAGGKSGCSFDRGTVWAFVNDGSGSLTQRAVNMLGAMGTSLATGDLDGDGDADVVAGAGPLYGGSDGQRSIWLLAGRGDGSFAAAVKLADRGGKVFTADLDGDSDLDIGSTSGLLLFNRGDGAFSEGPSLTRSWQEIVPGDLDGDGDVDLAAVAGDNRTTELLLNRGDGSFAPGPDLPHLSEFPAHRFHIADLDGDGRPDIAGSLGHGAVTVHKNLGKARFTFEVLYPAGEHPGPLVSADLEGDGDLDLITGNVGSDSITVLRNGPPGTFGPPLMGLSARGHVVAVDLDGDGDVDIAGRSSRDSSRIAFFENDGRGALGRRPGFELAGNLRSLTSLDLDEDFHADLAGVVLKARSFEIRLYRNVGGWNFVESAPLGTEFGPTFVAAADFDEDGHTDLAAIGTSPSDSILLYHNTGSGASTRRRSPPWRCEPGH